MKKIYLINQGLWLHTFNSVSEFIDEYQLIRFYLESTDQPVDLDWIIT